MFHSPALSPLKTVVSVWEGNAKLHYFSDINSKIATVSFAVSAGDHPGKVVLINIITGINVYVPFTQSGSTISVTIPVDAIPQIIECQ